MNRRRFLQQAGGTTALTAALLARDLKEARSMAATTSDTETLTSGELRVVVGNNQAGEGEYQLHRAGYNGVWSLTSVHAPENCFVPQVAGLNLEHFMDDLFMTEEGGDIFEPRHLPMDLERVSETAVRLTHSPGPLTGVSSETVFEVREPNIIDFGFRANLHHLPRAGGWMGFFWASYINAPDSPALYFKDASGLWSCLSADQHGVGSSICHQSIATPELGDPSRTYHDHSLAHAYSRRRFSLPLMYGRPGDGRMLLLFMFDQDQPVRLTMSPSGGGTNRERTTYNPAWDFQYIVPQARAGQEVRLRARVVYKLYQGRGEIEELYAAWCEELDT